MYIDTRKYCTRVFYLLSKAAVGAAVGTEEKEGATVGRNTGTLLGGFDSKITEVGVREAG